MKARLGSRDYDGTELKARLGTHVYAGMQLSGFDDVFASTVAEKIRTAVPPPPASMMKYLFDVTNMEDARAESLQGT